MIDAIFEFLSRVPIQQLLKWLLEFLYIFVDRVLVIGVWRIVIALTVGIGLAFLAKKGYRHFVAAPVALISFMFMEFVNTVYTCPMGPPLDLDPAVKAIGGLSEGYLILWAIPIILGTVGMILFLYMFWYAFARKNATCR